MNINLVNNMNTSLDHLKRACDENNGLYQVLVYSSGLYYIVGIDYYDDCMNDRLYYVDSRYDVKMKDIEKWIILNK